jgi:hypothetical protein
MAKRPTAFHDKGGEYASGIPTVIIYNSRHDYSLDWIARILNSDLGALIYLGLYGSLALSGGYMRFGSPQIANFPVPVTPPTASLEGASDEAVQAMIANAFGLDPADVADAFERNFPSAPLSEAASRKDGGHGNEEEESDDVDGEAEADKAEGAAEEVRLMEALEARSAWAGKAELVADTGISPSRWPKLIRELEERGKVERQGERRGARYRIVESN